MTARPNANTVRVEMHSPPIKVRPMASSVMPEADWRPRDVAVDDDFGGVDCSTGWVRGVVVEVAVVLFSGLKKRCSCPSYSLSDDGNNC